MPEGDTVFVLARRLNERVSGQVVTHFDALEPAIRGREGVVGQTLLAIEARGKNLLFRFSDGAVLHSHLRMEGRWVLRSVAPPPSPSRELRVVLGLTEGTLLGYRLDWVRWLDPGNLAADDPLRRLGPDLIADEVDVAAVTHALQALGKVPLGIAVMRQSVLAGIGNEYKSELLFLSRLHPETFVGEVEVDDLARFVVLARTLLRRNAFGATLGDRGRQTRYRTGGGSRLWVYGRGGQRCLVCDASVAVIKQGQPPRSTYFCPECQSLERKSR